MAVWRDMLTVEDERLSRQNLVNGGAYRPIQAYRSGMFPLGCWCKAVCLSKSPSPGARPGLMVDS